MMQDKPIGYYLIGKLYPLRAPAKLNLRLKITGRRLDGYHLLSMLNATLALSDEMVVEFVDEPGVTCRMDGPAVVANEADNLVCKAYREFVSNLFGSERKVVGARCILTKFIPTGSGCGGGSSDAAALLRVLLLKLGSSLITEGYLTKLELLNQIDVIALKVGADVPYFLHGGLAAVTGIGEKISPIAESLQWPCPVLLVFPKVALPTPMIYEIQRKIPIQEGLRDEALEAFIAEDINSLSQSEMVSKISGLVLNDLETAAIKVAPELKDYLDLMRALPDVTAGMTGSGSCLFLLPHRQMIKESEEISTLIQLLESHGARCKWTQFSNGISV